MFKHSPGSCLAAALLMSLGGCLPLDGRLAGVLGGDSGLEDIAVLERTWEHRRDLLQDGELDDSAEAFLLLLRFTEGRGDCSPPNTPDDQSFSCVQGVFDPSEGNDSTFTGTVWRDELLVLTQFDGDYVNQISGSRVDDDAFQGAWSDASGNQGDFLIRRVGAR